MRGEAEAGTLAPCGRPENFFFSCGFRSAFQSVAGVVGGIVVGVAAISYLAYDYFHKPKAIPKPSPRGPQCEKEPQRNCAEEWAEARAACAALLASRNPPRRMTGGYTSIEACARGFVSEECGGNTVDWGKSGPRGK